MEGCCKVEFEVVLVLVLVVVVVGCAAGDLGMELLALSEVPLCEGTTTIGVEVEEDVTGAGGFMMLVMAGEALARKGTWGGGVTVFGGGLNAL